MIIDAHAHIFPGVNGLIHEGPTIGLSYGRVAVGSRKIQVIPPFSEETRHTDEMLIRHMDLVGIDRAVLLQGPFYGECNQFVAAAARAHPDRLTGFAYFDPWDSRASESLREICQTESFTGVKVEFSFETGLSGVHPGAQLDSPELEWIWQQLEAHDLVLVVDLGAIGCPSYQTAGVRTIAFSHPKLTVVIAHLGQPNPAAMADPASHALWLEQIDLGLLPNVFFDTASLPAYVVQEGYPYPSAGRYLAEAIERIGAGKVMWGTDVPVLLTYATYSQLLNATREQLRIIGAETCARVLGQNAATVFGKRARL